MKLLVCILAATLLAGALALTEEQRTKLKKLSKECQEETGISDESLQKARDDEEVDPKYKEHVLCVAKKSGVINDAGEIQADVLREKIKSYVENKDDANRILDKCAVKKATPQETAMELANCLYKN